MKFLAVVAAIAAIAHVVFAYLETIGWKRKFVEHAAGAWIDPKDEPKVTDDHISWAKRLAFNIGVYNLVLAIGLAWTAYAAWHAVADTTNISASLGIFFSIWLLGAAAAAAHTQVYAACVLQGILGLVLLCASLRAS
jgi:uncharacterized membrane protein